VSRSLADRASFRDPAGYVTERDGVVLRVVDSKFVPTYRAVQRTGLLDELQSNGSLVAHEEDRNSTDESLALLPERAPFISYPYEWTPRQLRDASLLTLDIAERAFCRGVILRDASAYNVQFIRGRPVFIDTLSFEPWEVGTPWRALGQFCRHFLAPLSLASLVDPIHLKSLSLFPDGIPIRFASRTLGARGWSRPGLLTFVHLHALAERYSSRGRIQSQSKISPRQLRQTFESLRATVESLPFRTPESPWLRYDAENLHAQDSRQGKLDFVAAAFARTSARSIWDLGANRGEYTFANVPSDGYAATIDADLGCAEACYARAYRDRVSVVSIWNDLLAPTAPSGWANEERASLSERGPVDLVLALAVVHHLCINGGIPMDRVARWLSYVGRYCVIEVPESDDPKVRQLSDRFERNARPFSVAQMLVSISKYFDVVSRNVQSGQSRALFLLKSRSH
jgi:hypothetical protein